MDGRLLFLLSVVMSSAAWVFVSISYIWPRIKSIPLMSATRLLLTFHLFRFVGASFLIPGVAGTSLSSDFAKPAAFGDLIATVLAWVALALLNRKGGIPALWAFNIWGFGDLLFAFYKGAFGPGFEAGFLGATFYVPTVVVPLLVCSHFMIFVLLTGKMRANSVNLKKAR